MELKVTSSTEQMKWIRDFLRRLMNFSHHLTIPYDSSLDDFRIT